MIKSIYKKAYNVVFKKPKGFWCVIGHINLITSLSIVSVISLSYFISLSIYKSYISEIFIKYILQSKYIDKIVGDILAFFYHDMLLQFSHNLDLYNSFRMGIKLGIVIGIELILIIPLAWLGIITIFWWFHRKMLNSYTHLNVEIIRPTPPINNFKFISTWL